MTQIAEFHLDDIGLFRVCVFANEFRSPHFHLIHGDPENPEWETSCFIETSEFGLSHLAKPYILNAKQKKQLVTVLNEKNEEYNLSNWEAIIHQWNIGNEDDIPLNYRKPNYEHRHSFCERVKEDDVYLTGKGNCAVYVYGEDGSPYEPGRISTIPHFHIIHGDPEYPEWEVCIKIETAEYFYHDEKAETLNTQQKKELVEFLDKPSKWGG